ncbi:hypothetical protein [Halarchaeum salinum]|uniref:Uncharacterized protein n=1 Tax=Halarchaeum salinum TaxID=489912 RepID=A0AAV3S9K3_9EURY
MDLENTLTPKNGFLIAVVALAVIAAAATIYQTGLLVGILLSLAFLVGLGIMPLVGWIIGPSLPSVIGETLATTYLAPVFLGLRKVVLHQRDDGRFEVRPASDIDNVEETTGAWGRLAFTKTAIGTETSRDAYGTPPAPRDIDHLEPEGSLRDGTPTASYDLDRHGDWFVELLPDRLRTDGGQIRVPIGQALTELRGAGGTALGEEAVEEAMKKYGGDSSWGGHGGALIYIMDVVLLLIGLGTGYVLFWP